MSQTIDEIYAKAVEATGRSEAVLRSIAMQVFASMLQHMMESRDKVIWTAARIPSGEHRLDVEVDCPPRPAKFPDGNACGWDEMMRRLAMEHRITLDEGQRGMVLMALAHLAVERPGWDNALAEIAASMDNVGADGKPEMFSSFKLMKLGPRPAQG